MNILHTVQYYYPSVGGMQEVVRQLSERLVEKGYDVTVATTKMKNRKIHTFNRVNIIEFNISGNLAYGLSGEVEKYQKFLINSDYDIITNFAAQQCMTDAMLPVLDRIHNKKVFVPTGFSALYQSAYKAYFESMKSWMDLYDMNIFPSQNYRDINFAKDNGIKNITIIPNGAGADEFLHAYDKNIRKKIGIPDNHFLILHVGSHTGSKGHAEAIEIFEKARIANATLLIIGNSFNGGCTMSCRIKKYRFNISPKNIMSRKNLMIKNLPRSDTIAAYHTSNLFLFLSNIECSPLVLFECMASKTPFVSTDVGNVKEIIFQSRSGILLPTQIDKNGYSHVIIRKSVEILESIINGDKRRARMARYGYGAWKKYFTWEIITSRYEQLYKSLVDQN